VEICGQFVTGSILPGREHKVFWWKRATEKSGDPGYKTLH